MNKITFIIIAHRGESYDAPENTHAAINLAWERDADAVEIDVRLTKEERIVVMHDKSTFRTGGKLKSISSNTYENLLKVDVGKFKGTKWRNERIPLLDDVMEIIPDNKILFIEIKSDNKIVEPLIKLINKMKLTFDQIKFIGFDVNTMKKIKKFLPDFESFWIIESKHYNSKSFLESAVKKCKTAGLNGLDVQESKNLNSEVIKFVKRESLKIYTWTVDHPERAAQLYLEGIDGITTNRAGWLKTKLTEKKIIKFPS